MTSIRAAQSHSAPLRGLPVPPLPAAAISPAAWVGITRRSVAYVSAMEGRLHREKGGLPGEMKILCNYVNLLGVCVPTTEFTWGQVDLPGQPHTSPVWSNRDETVS